MSEKLGHLDTPSPPWKEVFGKKTNKQTKPTGNGEHTGPPCTLQPVSSDGGSELDGDDGVSGSVFSEALRWDRW